MRILRAWTCGLVLVLCGCGLTTTQSLEDIDTSNLPDRLVTAGRTPSAPSPTPNATQGAVYFLGDGRLVALPYATDNRVGQAALQVLLDGLATGPDDEDRNRGLSTALPPTTRLRLTALEGDVATVDLTVAQLPPNQTVAIAQLVLTVTSLATVNGMRLTVNGQPVDPPLASGAQTDRPLTRADYQQMLTAI